VAEGFPGHAASMEVRENGRTNAQDG